MNAYQKLSVAIGLVLFLPLAWQILRGRARQNIATFLLWGSLDGIAAGSIYFQDGNYALPAAYTAGSVLIIVCLLKVRSWEWTWVESFVTVLVIACIAGWKVSGPYMATILSSTGVFLAGLPQLVRDAWGRPKQFPTGLYSGYSIANIFGILGGREWTVEERLYPSLAFAICFLMVLASLRKYHDCLEIKGAEK